MRYFILLASLVGTQVVSADVCPPPPSSISPTMSSTVSLDKKSGLYTYRYTMSNGANAAIPINYFGLLVDTPPEAFESPRSWSGEFLSSDTTPDRFRWSTIDVGEAEARKIRNDATLAPPVFAISPGRSLGGFVAKSHGTPGPVQFFAQGFTQIPSANPTAGDDEPTPNCPGWDFENPQILTQVTGAAVGPLPPSTIPIVLRTRDDSGKGRCKPIHPNAPSGRIAVLVLRTRTFDPSKIDTSSVVFGPAFASPVSSRLVPDDEPELTWREERAGWEEARGDLEMSSSERNRQRAKNLLLVFDVASLDVQCSLDQTLFLRGKTADGLNIVGTVGANLAGCKPKEVGRHKRHSIPFKWWQRNHGGAKR